ncbi:MAG TPA: class I SAM-dependent methyltransferase [Caulobacter sp.]|nr:class I SAM-dependent methyltransferase [Caulobacter sp.]
MSKLQQYAQNQHEQYENTCQDLDSARSQVAPDYDQVRAVAPAFAHLILQTWFLRQGLAYVPGQTDTSELSVLDFGCGVGRVMEAFKDLGVGRVDGADISEAMLRHAAASPTLAGSNFFLTSGFDTGDSPAEAYDIVYSFLCFHHIPMRLTRLKILEAMARNLKPGGLCFVELKIYPGATAAKIPPNHAHWSENMVARHTNSASDVWVTPDALGMVYEDFRNFYNDVGMLELDTGVDLHTYVPENIYQLGFNELYVFGSKQGHGKWRLLNGDFA